MIPLSLRSEPPLLPDGPDAREWLVDELSKPVYTSAEPTAFDRLARAVRDWFFGLFSGGGLGEPLIAAIIVLLALGLVVAAFVIFGRPRAARRRRASAPLFGREDTRDAAELRASSSRAAELGDWALAIEERFRAIVRGLDERELVAVYPGTTAHGFAVEATTVFPSRREAFETSAAVFDGVRYLGRRGGGAEYERLRQLDAELEAMVPGSGLLPEVARS